MYIRKLLSSACYDVIGTSVNSHLHHPVSENFGLLSNFKQEGHLHLHALGRRAGRAPVPSTRSCSYCNRLLIQAIKKNNSAPQASSIVKFTNTVAPQALPRISSNLTNRQPCWTRSSFAQNTASLSSLPISSSLNSNL